MYSFTLFLDKDVLVPSELVKLKWAPYGFPILTQVPIRVPFELGSGRIYGIPLVNPYMIINLITFRVDTLSKIVAI